MVDILLLGPMEVRVSGITVSLSPLEQNLLAVLALARGTVLSTEKIIDSLWSDRHPASPRSRVQGLISSLRRKVGDILVTRHHGYMLDTTETVVDVDRFEELVYEARQAASAGEIEKYLRQAFDLWRGEPLDGVPAPGLEFERVRLAELRVGLLEEMIGAELELGRHAELVPRLTALVSAFPLRERLAGQLMVALCRCYRQAEALAVYQTLRERLAEELGSDPCADVRELHAAILRGDPVATAAEPPAAVEPENATAAGHVGGTAPALEPVVGPGDLRPAQLPASVGHFTGRDKELGALMRAVQRPADEPRVFMVSGVGG